jgi:DNA-binding NarL/FixJ family response regulator
VNVSETAHLAPAILIIEEDALMRSLLLEWLSATYHVTGAVARPDEAARADLVIIDVHMPRDRGVEQLRCLRREHPRAAIIAISGQFCRGLACSGAAARSLGVDAVIAKPCNRQTLLDAVRSLIGPPGDADHVRLADSGRVAQ